MKNINNLIYELVNYGKQNSLIDDEDVIYTTNRLLEFFKLDEYVPPVSSEDDDTEENASSPSNRKLYQILQDMTDYALEKGLLENDTITYRDLYDTAIMGLITPPPSVVRKRFHELTPKEATDYYYNFSKATNYIRTDRIAKDEKWITSPEYGDLDITINLSKP